MAKKNKKPSPKTSHVRTTAELGSGNQSPVRNRSLRFGRETIDALVVAFVLAFLIRTFQAEQFVIPTGSMAPTLMGRHNDIECAQSGLRFRVNASHETAETEKQIAKSTREALIQRAKRQGRRVSEREIREEIRKEILASKNLAGLSPQTGYLMPLRNDSELKKLFPQGTPEVENAKNYGGDRIVVNKYAYSFRDPERWDVIVFKYPGGAMANYIKRLVGLPNETLRILHGDIYTHPGEADSGKEFTIESKPADKVLALRQFVHDTDYDSKKLYEYGWPLRWQSDSDAWDVSVQETELNVKQTYVGNSNEETAWLRYQHTIPTEVIWERILAEPSPNEELKEKLASFAKPKLIGDFVAYNAGIVAGRAAQQGRVTSAPRTDISHRERDLTPLGLHWVGDLSFDTHIEVKSDSGSIHFDLVEAGTHYGVSIDIVSGEANFTTRSFESDETIVIANGKTPLRGPGNYDVRFANVDDQLLLWIDDSLVKIDGYYTPASSLEARKELIPQTSESDAGDLAPVGVGIENAEVKISRLQVYRDIYYLAEKRLFARDQSSFISDIDLKEVNKRHKHYSYNVLYTLAETPEDWDLYASRQHVDFEIGDGQFFVLGDNSAASLDARLWAGGNGNMPGIPGGPYLERHLLVGKALFVYWPHAWHSMPGTKKLVPLWPNFADMRFIR